MGKPLLTPEGVAEQVVALYELSPAELEAVADVINADIRSWLLDTFDVTAAQESYLDQLNPVYLAALGEQGPVRDRVRRQGHCGTGGQSFTSRTGRKLRRGRPNGSNPERKMKQEMVMALETVSIPVP